MNPHPAIAIVITAGCCASIHAADPIKTGDTIAVQIRGHIYFNAMTGERIATALDDKIRPANSDPYREVWVADNFSPCADFNSDPSSGLIVDAPNGEFGYTTREGDFYKDWADIEPDTVVDCLQFDHISALGDSDSNSDGIGDGIDGFAAQWIFFEEENGFDHCFCGLTLAVFSMTNLPGNPEGEGNFSAYRFTVDLAGSFSSSISFEVGDTDFDPQSAGFHHPGSFIDNPCNDQDSNGLADFGYGLRFIQPGRQDVDNADGDNDTQTGIDGVFSDDNVTALSLAHYRGTTIEIDNGDGTFSYEVIPDPGVNATGAEDGYDIYDETGFYTGTFWTGGFTCNDPDDGTVNPFGQIALTMYGPTDTVPCPVDLIADHELNGFDVFEFIARFNAMDDSVDFVDDNVFNGFDVFEFIALFNAGCP